MTQPSSPTTPSPSPDRKRATKLLAERREALTAIPPGKVLKPRVSCEQAIALTTQILGIARTNVSAGGELSDEAWTNFTSELSDLEPSVLTYFAAQDVIEAGLPAESVTRRRELRAKVRAHDQLLSKWARAAFEDDPVEGPIVAALIPGSGVYDDAQDTVGWVAMWRRHPEAREQSPITVAYLDEAEADATELLPLIKAEDTDTEARDLARRAYTAWATTFNHIAKVGTFLTSGDVTWPGITAPKKPAPRDTTDTTDATATTATDATATATADAATGASGPAPTR